MDSMRVQSQRLLLSWEINDGTAYLRALSIRPLMLIKYLKGIFEDFRASPRAPFSCENVNNKKESLGNSLV